MRSSRRPVQVVAHRGSSGSVAEHTYAAYELALAQGVDALECDVRLTRDGVLVCVHDRKVNRTSDGRGTVSTLELAELAELDFSSWKQGNVEVPDTERDGSVLTLERLLQLALDTRVEVHVETKHPTRYGALVEHALVALLQRYGLASPPSGRSRVTVMSFAPTSLRRVHLLAPALPTLYLMERVPVRWRDGSLPARVGCTGPSLPLLKAHPRYVARAQGRGHRVHCWTADDEDDIAYLLDLGVDAVISNHPERVLAQLGR